MADRICMKCREVFDSTGPENGRCKKCLSKAEKTYIPAILEKSSDMTTKDKIGRRIYVKEDS